MAAHLVISGAKERPNGFELGEGKYYDRAKLLKLDLASGTISTLLQISEGNKHYPEEHPNLQYTSCCINNGILWLPTDTEIYKYTYPSLELQLVISKPYFHNIHSINVFDNLVYVTSTGLDLVAVFDVDGNEKALFNVEGKELWHRFSKEKDYRIIHSTRPHDSHPNFVYHWQGEPWVTRCRQQDAVCLNDISKQLLVTDPENRISVHDGLVFNEKIYFTSVDGFIIICDPNTREIIQQINLIEHVGKGQLGWARGLCIDDNGIAYIGVSRIRRTKMTDKLLWLARGNVSKMKFIPASIIAFDLNNNKLVQHYDIPLEEIDAIYGVECVAND